MIKRILLLMLIGASFVLANCAKQQHGKLETIAGHWGQVNQLEQLAPTSLYLLFIKPQETYNVCVTSHLVDAHPHIMTEIDAAIKIWGRYIGRDVQTDITQVTLAAPSATEHQDTTFKNFIKACPNGDIVVGYGNINAVGMTANRYSYTTNSDGQHQPHNAQRVLMLQNPAFNNATWHSFINEDNTFADSDQLIDKIMERSQYHLLEKPKHYSTLTVLMHEFGHVWGLCDMYPLAGGHTNCHPIWSKKDENGNILLVPNANMAAAGWKNPVFLHDDDIEGIRTLAGRDRFHSLWANQGNFVSIPPAQEAQFLFKFRGVEQDQNLLTLNLAIYSQGPVTLTLTLNTDRGPLRYQPMNLQGPIDTNQYGIRLGRPQGVEIKSIDMTIADEQGKTLTQVSTNL